MERTIKVTGKGKLSVKPDITRLILTLKGNRREYADTLAAAAEAVESLKSSMEPFGFDRKDIRTVSFNVDRRDEEYEDKSGRWRRRFAGYEFTHRLKIEFPSDNDRLGRILYALARSVTSPEIRVLYTVADQEAVKNELLAKAVADSAAKAKVLASASGVILDRIETVDYSWAEVEFTSAPMDGFRCNAVPMGAEGSFDMDIEPDDIDVTDSVTVIWSIR